MALPTLTALCDAVAADLTGQTWAGSVTFTAARKYRPEFTLEELASLRVAVCPERAGKVRVSRSQWQGELVVTVGMQKKVGAGTTQEADCDALVAVWDGVCEFLEDRPQAGALPVSMDVVPFDRQHLLEHHVWTGTATVTYRGFR